MFSVRVAMSNLPSPLGPLDVSAINNFCELFEASGSLVSVSDAVAETCVNAKALKDDLSLKALLTNQTNNYVVDDSAGREVGKYDAGVTAEATDATLVQSLEHGFESSQR